ncbi:mycofactocin-coupled SDR family oxidoreductase [Micromonospora chokoriensis]|uniref:mycofactocin-coupled SDR family oxidoreductase n=1 Tax=Micromonospora chokoriensis TaxID=356851 RepID=UPI0004C3E395|nr:mycofactocin-coupled SDR family oxidoreductase [Micromonospora chokoriensis]
MAGRVAGKVAFVTGAARGLGLHQAIRFAEEGADIIAVDICGQVESVPYRMAGPGQLKETAERVEALGRRVVTAEVDVRDFGSLRAAVGHGVAELGRLDIVSANAGIISYGSAMEIDERMWQDVIDVNLTGAWNTARAAIPHLVENTAGGALVFTSSTAGLKGNVGLAHYASAKHGVVGLMRTLALELAPHSIRVNSVHPTAANTPMVQNPANMRLFMPDIDNPTTEQYADAMRSLNLLPVPWIEPCDVSNAVLFLASDEARYITGAALPVDAGWTIK